MHEGGVGAVLEHAAHEVRQQVGEVADRRIHAHRDLALREQCFVEGVTHTHELLELEFASLCQLENGGDRAAVVGRECRIDGLRCLQQGGGAGDI